MRIAVRITGIQMDAAMILKVCHILSQFGCLIMFDLDLMILMQVPREFEHFEMWHGFNVATSPVTVTAWWRALWSIPPIKLLVGLFHLHVRHPEHRNTTEPHPTSALSVISVRSTLRPLTVQLPHRTAPGLFELDDSHVKSLESRMKETHVWEMRMVNI